MKIFIQHPTGHTIAVEFHPYSTIFQVKEKLRAYNTKEREYPIYANLRFAGMDMAKSFDNGETLRGYNIQNGDLIVLSFKADVKVCLEEGRSRCHLELKGETITDIMQQLCHILNDNYTTFCAQYTLYPYNWRDSSFAKMRDDNVRILRWIWSYNKTHDLRGCTAYLWLRKKPSLFARLFSDSEPRLYVGKREKMQSEDGNNTYLSKILLVMICIAEYDGDKNSKYKLENLVGAQKDSQHIIDAFVETYNYDMIANKDSIH